MNLGLNLVASAQKFPDHIALRMDGASVLI